MDTSASLHGHGQAIDATSSGARRPRLRPPRRPALRRRHWAGRVSDGRGAGGGARGEMASPPRTQSGEVRPGPDSLRRWRLGAGAGSPAGTGSGRSQGQNGRGARPPTFHLMLVCSGPPGQDVANRPRSARGRLAVLPLGDARGLGLTEHLCVSDGGLYSARESCSGPARAGHGGAHGVPGETPLRGRGAVGAGRGDPRAGGGISRESRRALGEGCCG